MTTIEINHLDPWLKQAVDDRAIDSATFVGRYGVDIGIDIISAAVFLRRAPPGHWELWAVDAVTESDMEEILRRHAAHDLTWRVLALSRGLAAAGVGEAADRDAAKYLLERLQRATIHYSWPCEPFAGGLLSAEELAHGVA
jgi:hypothetical protein